MCRFWRSGGLGVGRALMRSGSEKIRGSRWCGVCASDLRLVRSDLTQRFSQPTPTNNEWHSGTVPHAVVCAIFACNRYLILSSALFSFFQYILALSLDSSLCCSCLLFWCISPHCHSVMLALRDFFHTSVPILMYYIRLGFTLQPISSSFSFLLPLL